jgi:beta-lactamase superfamily II metal-dependent hydrolase
MAALAAASTIARPSLLAAEPTPEPMIAGTGERFKPWAPGCLDLHHISTGRGNAMLAICPDGTIMLVDAGATPEPLKYSIPPKPDASRRPGEWIGRYVARHIAATGATGIDAFLATHLHNDHIGGWAPDLPQSERGDYLLTGITDLAERVPIRKLIDHGYPDYSYPPKSSYAADAQTRLTIENYRRYVSHRTAHGEAVERFVAGAGKQLALVHTPEKFPDFHVRNLAVNGEVWTGQGDTTTTRFPAIHTLKPAEYPTENMCSAAIRVQYGRFSYYTGGDLPFAPVGWFDPPAWCDIETAVAQVAGPVSVAVANHHGYIDSMSPACVRALRPRAFVIFAWDSAHPTIRPLYNMLSRSLYPEERAIFATATKDENVIATRDLAKLQSLNGHVVVRVPPGGETFTVEILDNADESDRLLARHGPYPC